MHLLDDYAKIVESELARVSISSTGLGAAAAEALGRGGKRVRPAVALLACEAVSGSYARAIPVAMAYELAHAASLAQDDIIDASEVRRGVDTAHKRYGVANAILISDLLIFK